MITVVFGKPGSGKTAYLAATAAAYLNGSANDYTLTKSCRNEVSSLIDAGMKLTLPEHAPVYSNFALTVRCGYGRYNGSYYIDGFHMGFQNDFVPVIAVLPGSKIFLSEAQRYYNSRKSKDLPDWVSRFYEEHRHYGLDIYLDVQRPGLIDVNIRDIAGRFIEIEKLSQKKDKDGKVVSTDFRVKEFEDWKFVDKYINSDEKSYITKDESFPYNVFDFYESQSYYRNFLPETDFDYIPHVALDDVEKDIRLSQLMYRQTAPPGFYAEKRGSNADRRTKQ